MLNAIDNILGRITMYRLVLYYLIGLLVVAVMLGCMGVVPYSPWAILISAAICIGACWASNDLFARICKAQTNVESSWITGLILALIISPALPSQIGQTMFLVWASILAMASKYALAANKKHFFNPAAIAVVITAFATNQSATWWACGTLAMIPWIIAGGLLMTRKIGRFDLVLSFLLAAFASIIITAGNASTPLESIQKALTHAPIFFFAFVMLTEPLTTPPERRERIMYGIFTGLIFAPRFHIGTIYSTPELALVVGNLFSYALSPKSKTMFSLQKREHIGGSLYNFILKPDEPISFKPGQYFEWTLSHAHADTRGTRRYFTIASSPTEANVMLGIRFEPNGSSFKGKMMEMENGDHILGGSLAGDFILPEDRTKKIAFIAGGIGITPFRSMAKFLSDSGDMRNIVMLYANRASDEIAYREVFDEAAHTIGMKTIYAITSATDPLPPEHGYRGRIDAKLIQKEMPDFRERLFYISGTHAMVVSFKKTLRELGVPRKQIKTDFFPGF